MTYQELSSLDIASDKNTSRRIHWCPDLYWTLVRSDVQRSCSAKTCVVHSAPVVACVITFTNTTQCLGFECLDIVIVRICFVVDALGMLLLSASRSPLEIIICKISYRISISNFQLTIDDSFIQPQP